MTRLSFTEICAAVAELPAEERVAACLGLNSAAQQGAADQAAPGPLQVFDPLECRPDDAGRCAFFGRPVQHEHRICAVAVEPGVNCPDGGR
jgi:hypothetical protein